jgi:hypothetical protein
MYRLLVSILFAALFIGSAGASRDAPSEVPSVAPIFLRGSPSCEDLGFPPGVGFLIDGPGSRALVSSSGDLAFETNGFLVRWTSTTGIKGVIVSGGPNALHYRYYPPSAAHADGGQHGPLLEDGSLPALSRLSFCFEGQPPDFD